jgi:FlaA1/EpsC-like NDP-sugar epimerase
MYPLTFDLDNKVVVITGGAGVLGSHFSKASSDAIWIRLRH